MKLYFSPMAGSLAVRIALHEAGREAEFVEVPRRTKALRDGRDYRQVHPLGLVPLLELDDGERLTELVAILTYLAESAGPPNADLLARARLAQWLSFIATELHKGLFFPLFDLDAPEAARTYALMRGEQRLGWLSHQMEGREWLLESFGVADAYLLTVLSWCVATPVDLGRFPNLLAYLKRGLKRPQVARALAEEKPLYLQALSEGRDVRPTTG